jgi:small subunit ribosomal protein S6
MRRYETIIIVDPELSTEERDPVLQRVADIIQQGEGYLALTDEWGARKLAYEIKKKDRGYYIRFDFCGAGAVVDEMERFFRIDDRVMKYMTVLLDKTADIEKIKEEIAEAQSKAATDKAQAETAEPMSQEEPSETGTTQPTEAPSESTEIQSPEEPAEAEEKQTPEVEVGENEAANAETEEEKK